MNSSDNQGRRPAQHAFAETMTVACVVGFVGVLLVRWISGW